jgi:uridine kinase
MDVGPVLDRVAALTPAASAGRGFLLLGIGGHGGSGKTTLARLIPGAQVVGTDEFWDGTGFELSRLRSEVLEPILQAEPAEYRAYSWQLRRPLEKARVVLPQGVIVVEGVCALHVLFREAYDLRIWVDTPRRLRLARGIARDGEGARSVWETRWMPSEDRYVERDDPISAAHMIVDGSK